MALSKAETLDDIYKAFRATPLDIEDLAFYVPVASARGNVEPRSRMARRLNLEAGSTPQHIIFVGYKGCGKSTELNHLRKDLENSFLSLSFSVQNELDPIHLNFIELYIVTMELLFKTAIDNDLKIGDEYLDSVKNWLLTREIQEIREKYLGVEGEIGAEAKLSVGWLASFFAKFKLSARTSGSFKEILKSNVEPKLSDLIFYCNTLITEIKNQLNSIGKQDILLIMEDLDKIPLDRASELFFTHVNQLVLLKTNIIFTFPVALYYHIKFNTIRPYFEQVYELPMIQVHEKNGDPYEEGISCLTKIIEKRMKPALFEEPAILRGMIQSSGGCIRDLFLLIQEAAQVALDMEREKINESDSKAAFSKLKKEYDASIADFNLGNEKFTASKYYETLVALANNPTKKPENTNEVLHLRQNLCILGYNGEGWCDVHPVVIAILKERQKL